MLISSCLASLTYIFVCVFPAFRAAPKAGGNETNGEEPKEEPKEEKEEGEAAVPAKEKTKIRSDHAFQEVAKQYLIKHSEATQKIFIQVYMPSPPPNPFH